MHNILYIASFECNASNAILPVSQNPLFYSKKFPLMGIKWWFKQKKDDYQGVPHIPTYHHIQNQVTAVILLALWFNLARMLTDKKTLDKLAL